MRWSGSCGAAASALRSQPPDHAMAHAPHYGVIGFPENPVMPRRVIGVVLLVAGVVLIMRR